MGYDFDGVARAALAAGETLLPRWIGGKRVGQEWVGERTRNGGIGDSWSINLHNGKWRHFAGSESGSDIISFYAAVFRVNMGAAFHAVQGALGGASSVPVLPMRSHDLEPESKADPIPEDAPALTDHPDYGPATATYRYGDRFVVTRYDFLDGEGNPQKIFAQWTWRRGKWAKQGPGSNRPLYHAHEFARDAGARVLVVEGEKCVEAARRVLSGFTVTTWAGGAQAWRHSDWSPLAGRDVIIWPDADPVGREAAAELAASLASSVERVRIVNPNGADPGWDIADAIDKEGWGVKQLSEFMQAHFAEPALAKNETPTAIDPEPEGTKAPRNKPQTSSRTINADGVSHLVTWDTLRLAKKDGGVPYVSTANGSAVLQRHPTFTGKIWFDDFGGEVFHTLRGEPQPWTDMDTRRVTVFIQEQLDLHKFTVSMMNDAVMHAAECNIRNPVTEYLNSLEWDGENRLNTWLSDCAGVEFNAYSEAVACNWLIGMVARAYRPGVKMDNMPVLEGLSGLNKTQLLEVLGGDWYKALPMEFGSKDFKQALRGAWLVEIPDMTGFGRVAHSQVLAELSIPIDHYRQSYGRRSQKYPRTCVFAATSETSDYLPDYRGKRRYWPLRCTDIDLDILRRSRNDLFAEAVARYREGAKWYVMPEGTADEQLARTTADPWEVYVMAYAEEIHKQSLVLSDKVLRTEDILVEALGKRVSELTQADKRRVALILKAGDFEQPSTGLHRHWRKRVR